MLVKATRVLVVEDSPLVRQMFVDMLRREEDFEVVGYARDGEEALARAIELTPDVITLDVDMPNLDGLGCLRELTASHPTPTVMISMNTPAGIETTLEALSLGATDFVCKPECGSLRTLRGIREELVAKVRHAGHTQTPGPRLPVYREASVAETGRVVLLTGSTGCIRSLEGVFEGLPKGFAAPVLISVALPPAFIAPLAQRLSDIGTMPVVEARPGDRPEPGTAYIGAGLSLNPAGYLELTDTSADDFLRSAAILYGDLCIAALLSGSGCDGADGAMAIRRAGGAVFAQTEDTCTDPALPESAFANGSVERSIPLESLGNAIAATAIESLYWLPAA